MSESQANQQQNISDIFDNESNELDIRRLLKTLNTTDSNSNNEADTVLKQWDQHQQLSDALHKRDTSYSDSGLSFLDSLNKRIESEVNPTTLSQKFSKKYGRILSQTALAASVSFVAILGVQQYQVAQYEGNPEAYVQGSTYAPTQFPDKFPVVIANSQPVSKRTYSQPLAITPQSAQQNLAKSIAEDASQSESLSQPK